MEKIIFMIIDSFNYFNEEEILDLRLNYLSDLVDKFLIVEANITHQGKKKGWNLEKLLKDKFSKFSEKIIYYKKEINLAEVDKEIGWGGERNGMLSWKIENFQRNSITDKINQFDENSIILISDLDEIPSRESIKFIKGCDFQFIQPLVFDQKLFQLNCNYLTLQKWLGTIAVYNKVLKTYSPQFLRMNNKKFSIIANSGWSFSSFGGIERIIEKFSAFAHSEYNNDEFKDKNHILNCISSGEDIFKRNSKKKKIDKNFFPKKLLDLLNKDRKFYFSEN